jgi:hypothetical protein
MQESGKKLVAVFTECPGQPPLINDEIQQAAGQAAICATCPLRCPGLVLDKFVEVDANLKAVYDGEEPRRKKSYSDGVLVPTCFHLNKSDLASFAPEAEQA